MLGYGEKLRCLRIQRKMTLEQAAKIVGVAKSTYAGYETEFRQPSLEKLTLFANYYNVSLDYLLGLKASEEKEESSDPMTRNVKEMLNSTNLHWDGIPLSEEELMSIRELLENTAQRHGQNKKLIK
ncbi:helix-turn-helix transcriptional regulator [Pullulanibacillus sp. KACC 23026]|uniref:helix-turn-helix domain-containing protein n=1 Tax=Pullulanibacillus sp. KACC 23026 TaxID=3028315 RepID=UPI0023AF4F18|nr:helix-turn-helix transcriptional regulator [Pullulanibacillus sp. KACC 23026]WEG10969.1 helix-turn-helix transcriptional regulator [Pullulanibacillus sp. KACC 23026]